MMTGRRAQTDCTKAAAKRGERDAGGIRAKQLHPPPACSSSIYQCTKAINRSGMGQRVELLGQYEGKRVVATCHPTQQIA